VAGSRLTPRQIKFALALAESPSIAAAGRAAGYAESSLSSLFRLCRRPTVRAIAYARREQIAAALPIKSEAVIALLWGVARNPKTHAAHKITAAAELLKWLGPPGGAPEIQASAEGQEETSNLPPPLSHLMVMASHVGVPVKMVEGPDGELVPEVTH
jgi:phage terminase small subunit